MARSKISGSLKINSGAVAPANQGAALNQRLRTTSQVKQALRATSQVKQGLTTKSQLKQEVGAKRG